MSSEDWYRNTEWNEEISAAFEAKLKRARSQKQEYVRIQACCLTTCEPTIALDLSDRYFDMGDDLGFASAYTDRADAYINLNLIDDAVDAFEKAIAREIERPGWKTSATRDFPLLIATLPLPNLFTRAIEVLDNSRGSSNFPIEVFKRHASFALILPHVDDKRSAARFARTAVEAAKESESGLRYHQALGLVGEEYSGLVAELERISDAV